MVKCPHCGRVLIKHERYCYHCEQYAGKAVDEDERIKMPKPRPYDLEKEFKKYRDILTKVIKKYKKTSKEVVTVTGYCVKCGKKVYMKDPHRYDMKNKRIALKGECPHCSTKVFRIIGKK